MIDVRANLPAIHKYINENLTIQSTNGSHDLTFIGEDILSWVTDVVIIKFRLENIQEVPDFLDISNSLIIEKIENHESWVLIEYNWKAGIIGNESLPSLIYYPGDAAQRLSLTDASVLKGFTAMIGMGMHHIWTGFDHVLFLVALLLPSVIIFSDSKNRSRLWGIPYKSFQPVDKFKLAFVYILKVVTLFTIAHTVTLGLVALDVIVLPSRLVESVIAVSIALAAAHNIRPVFIGKEWMIAFGFGLFHGFGFASILKESAMRGEFLELTLFGFNLGVEVGQVAIICLLFPMLYFIRNLKLYTGLLVTGSVVLMMISSYWFIERAFEVDLPLGRIVYQFTGFKIE